MSLQWTIIATFLYVELFVCVLLMLPIISPQRWQRIFRSNVLKVIYRHAHIYYTVFLAILAIVFFDSIRDVRRHSSAELPDATRSTSDAENTLHMKLFRAQRNFYIAGISLFMALNDEQVCLHYFTSSCCIAICADSLYEQSKYSSVHREQAVLISPQARADNDLKMFRSQRNMFLTGAIFVLCLVIRQLAILLSQQATLMAECEASRRQAESATAAAKRLMEESTKKPDEKLKDGDKKLEEELAAVKKEVSQLQSDLKKSRLDADALKKQSEGVNTEYDRLLQEHSVLQKKYDQLSGASSDKKGD